MKPHLLVIGYCVAAIEGLAEFINLPSPPKNYKDPDKIREWSETVGNEKLREARHESAYGKLTGRITSIFAVDPSVKETFMTASGDSASPTEQFLTWLTSRYGRLSELFPESPESRETPKIVFFGFDPKQFLRVLGTESLSTNSRRVPLGLWYQNESVYDPYDMLVESNRRSLFDLYGMLRLLNVKLPSPDWAPHQDAIADARVAAELLYRYQLYPPVFESEETVAAEQFKALMLSLGDSGEPPAETNEDAEVAIDPADELGQNGPESGEESPPAEDEAEEAQTRTPARTPTRVRRSRPVGEVG